MKDREPSERSRRTDSSRQHSHFQRKEKSSSKSERDHSTRTEERLPLNKETKRNQKSPDREPMKGYPGLYLPKTASIFNPFLHLKFSGTGDKLYPVLFIRKCMDITRFKRVDPQSQLHYFAMCNWISNNLVEY